jgi:hypothetical protein
MLRPLHDRIALLRILSYGVEAKASTPAELDALIAAEIPSWRKVIEERNVKTE